MAALLLLTPAVAMRFTGEVNWGPSDFVVAAVLIAVGAMLVAADPLALQNASDLVVHEWNTR